MNKIKWWIVLPVVIFVGILAVMFALQSDPENEFVIPDHIIICLDPGHGGDDPGAVLGDRQEKDDNLRMALAVRDKLEAYGFENLTVMLTREEDTALELQQRVDIANDAKATLFISIHRNSSPYSNQYTGIESLVYNRNSIAGRIAENINRNLTGVGFANQGIQERTNLAVLRRTNMPAVLVEVGFINTDRDNARFDSRFNEIAEAIADGILDSI